jgi:hypothetical protein
LVRVIKSPGIDQIGDGFGLLREAFSYLFDTVYHVQIDAVKEMEEFEHRVILLRGEDFPKPRREICVVDVLYLAGMPLRLSHPSDKLTPLERYERGPLLGA